MTSLASRKATHARVSAALAQLSEAQLMDLVDAARPLASGIGGSTLALELEGMPVFAKRVRLTDLERRPEHHLSTANLFGLPSYYHRNVGSAGFGAWRELAAQQMTSAWVLSGQLENFPLMYHWRVLDGAASPNAAPPPAEMLDAAGMSRYWEGSAAVEERLNALASASASVLICMEYLPCNLSEWLNQQLVAGPQAIEASFPLLEQGLTRDLPKMNALGLLHGDAHHGNILTDGKRLYFADLGLALSDRFDLSRDEKTYLRDNATLDRAYALQKWVNWLVKVSTPQLDTHLQRMALVQSVADGEPLSLLIPDLPNSRAAIIERYAPVAAAINDFYGRLHEDSRSSPYPRAQLEALLQRLG